MPLFFGVDYDVPLEVSLLRGAALCLLTSTGDSDLRLEGDARKVPGDEGGRLCEAAAGGDVRTLESLAVVL